MTVAYAFGSHEATVGQQLVSQLVITSHAHQGSVPVRISQLQISYDGLLTPVCIKGSSTHQDKGASSAGQEEYTDIHLEEANSAGYGDHITPPSPAAKACMVGEADLRLAPRQTKVLSYACALREAGTTRVKSVTLSMAEELFDVDYIVPFEARRHAGEWWTRSRKGLKKQSLARENTCAVKILPRPPRMQLYFANLRAEYYINELITIALDVHNEEDEETEVLLEVRLLGDFESPPELAWDDRRPSKSLGEQSDEREEEFQPPAAAATTRQAGAHRIGRLLPSAYVQTALSFRASAQPADYSVEIKAVYTQRSDPHTPLSKIIVAAFPIVAPFEVTFDFSPRVHPEPWPDYSQLVEAEAEAREEKENERVEEGIVEEREGEGEEEDVVDPLNTVPRRGALPARRVGITQRWVLTAILVSLAQEDLYLDAAQVQVLGVSGNAVCSVTQEKEEQEERVNDGVDDDDDADTAGARSSSPPPSLLRIAAAGGQRLRFIVDVLKKSALADRRPVALDLALAVTWRRPDPGSEPYALTASGSSSSSNATMTVYVPRLLVHAGEPRVLAAASTSISSSSSSALPPSPAAEADPSAEAGLLLLHLDYTIENPTPRPLALALLLEPSTDFAVVSTVATDPGHHDDDNDGGNRHGVVGGAAAAAAARAQPRPEEAQQQLVQLEPVSRRTVRFSVRPAVRGAWIRPQLRVLSPPPLLDRGSGPSFSPFSARGVAAGTANWPGATVRVSATEAGGIRTDARGMLVWVDAED